MLVTTHAPAQAGSGGARRAALEAAFRVGAKKRAEPDAFYSYGISWDWLSCGWKLAAVRQLRKIAERGKRQGIHAEVQQLAHWPNCAGDIKRPRGRDDYRLRIDDHRVIFEIDQSGNQIIVTITQVEKRNERTY